MREYGSGHRVFFCVHGWGGGHRSFEPLVPFLPADVRLVSIDLPGYGDSPPLKNWNPEELQEELVALVDELDGPMTLIGNCSGAAFGMLAVEKRPNRFDAMVLIDPFGYFPWYFTLLVTPILGRFFYYCAFETRVGRFITNGGLASKRGDADLTASFRTLNHSTVYQYLLMLWTLGSYRRFEAIQLPTKLLWGSRSFAAVQSAVPLWGSLWTDFEALEMPTGHLPIAEAPEALSHAMFGSENAR